MVKVVLTTYNAEDTAYLLLTDEQERLLRYLYDEGWLIIEADISTVKESDYKTI